MAKTSKNNENGETLKNTSSVFNENKEGTKPNQFLIVGIGASAGGIEALKEFFLHVPADSNMAYVVILHLSPDHDSQLAQVLQHTAKIPVMQITEKVQVEPNHVYVISPSHHLQMLDGHITVTPNITFEERRAPVDIFFRTLAESHESRAVAVILSGTGANGSMGLKRIKERGGATFVQSLREAEFTEMPRNSIATELVDQVLPVAEIPAHIISFRNNIGAVEITQDIEKRPQDEQQALREIFTQLRVRTGHDFSNYKRPTLLRRIERRISIFNLTDLPAYAAFVQNNPHEANALLRDLLISVTNFFRDKKAFEMIEQEVIPAILKGKSSESQLRIWIAGCATGEEAYSLAILFFEQLMDVIDAPKLQIFATDIDENAIASAREGLYTINDLADVSPERLRRFFNKEDGSFRVRREIKETILFVSHNFIKDPPFSHLDLISCRNVMIYLNNIAQERVVETFHFALNPGSYLFLGNSESVDGATDLYATYNRDQHIFQSRQASRRSYPIPESVPSFQTEKQYKLNSQQQEEKVLERISFADLHQQLLEQYAAPSLVINEDYDIVHLSERAGKYLQIGGGDISQNLLKLIKPEMRLELRSALYQATQQQAPVEAKGLKVNIGELTETLNIQIRPVSRQGDNAKGFILVLFEIETAEPGTQPIILSSDEPVAKQLEEELIKVKAQLRSSGEQHEFQSEELKASNEELQAMNEELRSAAEELETSKEELQSINEEMRTVNQELKVKIEETSLTSNNLQNLINSTNIGTIFLDRSLKVSLFTPAIKEIFNLIPADYGRPVTDITNHLNYENLAADAETVMDKLKSMEKEIISNDNKTFLMRLTPYRTMEDKINGVVITFLDITERKKQEEKQQFLLRLSDAIRSLTDPLDIQSVITHTVMKRFNADRCYFSEFNGDIATIQQDAAKPGLPSVASVYSVAKMPMFKVSLKAGKPIVVPDTATTILIDDDLKQTCLHAGILSFINIPVKISGEVVGNLCITQGAKRDWTNEEINLATEVADRTWVAIERGRAETALRKSEERLKKALEIETVGVIFFNDAGTIQEANNAFLKMSGYTQQLINHHKLNIKDLTPPEWLPLAEKAMNELMTKGVATPYEKELFRADKSRWWGLCAKARVNTNNNVEYIIDVTNRRATEETLHQTEERYRIALLSANMATWDWNVVEDTVQWNEQHYYLLGLQPDGEKKCSADFIQSIYPDDLESVSNALQKAVNETGLYQAEFRIVRADDKRICWMSGYGRAVTKEKDKATRMIGVMFDITDRKKLEQQKEDFISIASHELKTPVTSIQAYGELLQDVLEENGSNENRQLIEKMNGQVNRLRDLVMDLLDTTKISEGQLLLAYEDFSLTVVVHELSEELQRISQRHRLITICDEEIQIHADKKRVEQVLNNIIANAIKYSPDGGEITITCRVQNKEAKVSVTDTGIGISKEMQEQVFNRFFRASSMYPGMGLGLFISSGIIRSHGGSLSVQSNGNKGTVFSFTLPGVK